MNQSRLLIADQDIKYGDDLYGFLKRSGWIILLATTSDQVYECLQKQSPDVLVMEVSLKPNSGREVVRSMRHKDNWTPVTLVSSINDATEKAIALEEGADDYIEKPFNNFEFAARVKALLRRSLQAKKMTDEPAFMISDNLVLNLKGNSAFVNETEIRLTAKAYDLLEYLMRHSGQLLSREQILTAVWGWEFSGESRAIDVRIAELRRNLKDNSRKPKFIESIHGKGYKFIAEVMFR